MLFFLTRELSLINTCCWRADHGILIHNGERQSEVIFVFARERYQLAIIHQYGKIILILILYRMKCKAMQHL